MKLRWARALACGAFGASLAAGAAAACPVAHGDRIVLAAQSMDPDVFVWDTVQRLADYARGDYSVKLVLDHTLLAEAGTPALVVKCHHATARTSGGQDFTELLLVRIVRGPASGRSGWIAAEDARHLNGKPVSPPRR